MKPQRIRRWALTGGVIGALVLAGLGAPTARAAEPIRIGFGMALTGGLSANGKPALLAVQIWKDDVNKRGGLLGRPVELVYYDRSEEHTSELQSQSNLVCRLLLEKKKKKYITSLHL